MLPIRNNDALQGGNYCIDLQILICHLCLAYIQWPILSFYGVSPTRDRNYRGIIEVGRELFYINGSGGDNEFQIFPAGEQLFQETRAPI